MKFSIIVPVFNGEETIYGCINALINQDYHKKDYEIVVVSDGSTDNTLKIVKSFKPSLVKLIDSKHIGKIKIRELGAKTAKYNHLLFIDARCIVDKNILKNLKNLDYQPTIGYALPAKNHSKKDRFFYLLRKKYYLQPKKDILLDKNNLLKRFPKGTGILLCNKKLFLECLPRRNTETKQINDDIEFFNNLVKRKKILKSLKIKATYYERKKGIFKRWYLRGLTFADFYIIQTKKHYASFLLSIFLISIALFLAIFIPKIIIYEILLIIILFLLSSIYIAEKSKDIITIIPFLATITSAFILGIIRRKIKFILIYFTILITILVSLKII